MPGAIDQRSQVFLSLSGVTCLEVIDVIALISNAESILAMGEML